MSCTLKNTVLNPNPSCSRWYTLTKVKAKDNTHPRTLPHGTRFPFTEALVQEVPAARWAVSSPARGRRQLPVLGGAPSFTPCPVERIWLDGGYWFQANL